MHSWRSQLTEMLRGMDMLLIFFRILLTRKDNRSERPGSDIEFAS